MVLKKTKVYSGLQAFFADIYSYIGGGLLVTGATSYLIVRMIQDNIIRGYTIFNIACIMLFLFSLYINFKIHSMTALEAQITYWLFVLLQGVITGFYAYVYYAHIMQAAIITACIFIVMGLLGRFTSIDLLKYSHFFTMVSISLFIASIVNVFIFKSGLVMTLIDCGIVLFFSALIMYNHQALEQMYYTSEDKQKVAIIGALSLYTDIVVVFRVILRLLASRSKD